MSSWKENFETPEKVVKAEMLGIKTTAKRLRRMYHEENMSCTKIGEELGCSDSTARKLMIKAGVERRENNDTHKHKKYRDKKWLKNQYENEERSPAEIAERCMCAESTIYNYIAAYNLENPNPDIHSERKYRDEEWLREQFLERGKTAPEIADGIDAHYTTVSNWIDNFELREELPTKCNFHLSRGGSMSGYPKWTATGSGGPEQVLVHSLVMVAKGADPEKVFADRDYQIHHRNGFKCDNRPSNLELLDKKTHGRHHGPDNKKWTDDDILAAMRLMMDPSKVLEE